MIGTRQGKFRFYCPHCGAPPGKPCIETRGPRKGKTCAAHTDRWFKFKRATAPRDELKAIWFSHYEGNRHRH